MVTLRNKEFTKFLKKLGFEEYNSSGAGGYENSYYEKTYESIYSDSIEDGMITIKCERCNSAYYGIDDNTLPMIVNFPGGLKRDDCLMIPLDKTAFNKSRKTIDNMRKTALKMLSDINKIMEFCETH